MSDISPPLTGIAWEEDGASPISLSGETSATVSLNGVYDAVSLICVGDSSANDFLDIRVNGDSSANYDFVFNDGATTTGASQVERVAEVGSCKGQVITMTGRWSGDWSCATNIQSSVEKRATGGRNESVVSPLDTITLSTRFGNSVDTTWMIFGLVA
jgi:hypothetical protein